MARAPEGPPPPPVVQRLRVHYAKRGRLRFTSHRDFQRALERAVRRAALPVGYSAGFTPHPKISYAGAAPTGVASEAEYLEIGLTERRHPDEVRAGLAAALPAGLDVVRVVEAGPGALADRLDASLWRVELPGVEAVAASAAVGTFLARRELIVERLTKEGRRRLDARAPVIRLAVSGEDAGADRPCAILEMVVRHVTPAVRPDDVLTGMRQVADCVPPPADVRVTRLAQGPLGSDGRIADPLGPLSAPDSAAVGT